MGILVSISFEEGDFWKAQEVRQKLREIQARFEEAGVQTDVNQISPERNFLHFFRNHSYIWQRFHEKYPEASKDAYRMGAFYVPPAGSPEMPFEKLVAWLEKWWENLLEVAKEVYFE